MNFNGTLKDIKERGSIDKPIAVRKDEENYILVAGMNRLCAAKLLGFKKSSSSGPGGFSCGITIKIHNIIILVFSINILF